MDRNKYSDMVKGKIITLIDSLLDKKVHPVEALRELLPLRHEIDMSNDEDFLLLIGICSQADEFPVGKARKNYNQVALAEYDKELNEYLNKNYPNLKKACLAIKNKIYNNE